MLWLCLHFPDLPLEVVASTLERNTALVLSGTQTHDKRLFACNAAALQLGVRPGMPTRIAALTGNIQIRNRDESAEIAALKQIATWAMQFTSFVSLIPPQALLLEVAGSLRLFENSAQLTHEVELGLRKYGHVFSSALSPTPLSAHLLARHGKHKQILDRHLIPKILANMPIRDLDIPDNTKRSLGRLGLATLQDCLRLPRAGLIRRFGPTMGDYFDRLLGKLPDPRKPFVPNSGFETQCVLPSEVTNTEVLLFAVRRLLLELSRFLSVMERGAQVLNLLLLHHNQPATSLVLDLVKPSRDPQHLFNVIQQRLEHTTLPATVHTIYLKAKTFIPLAPPAQDLFAKEGIGGGDLNCLLDLIYSRLNTNSVKRICLVDDHRPERAWRYGTCTTPIPVKQGPRPLWLLTNPRPLITTNTIPHFGEPLNIKQGPERIESGWWDNREVARDYYIAENSGGSKFWIFQERKTPGKWFLHGIFA